MVWPRFLPALKGFDCRFYRQTKLLRAVPTGAQGYGAQCLPLASKCLPIVQETLETEIRRKKVAAGYRIKECPVPQSLTITYRLIRLFAPLLSHQTLPLKALILLKKVIKKPFNSSFKSISWPVKKVFSQQFITVKNLKERDPDFECWIRTWIRIPIHIEMLDPDP